MKLPPPMPVSLTAMTKPNNIHNFPLAREVKRNDGDFFRVDVKPDGGLESLRLILQF